MGARIVDIAEGLLAGSEDSVVQDLSPNERLYVISVLDELEKGRTGLVDAIWMMDFDKIPVSVDKFLDDDYYFGKVGKDIYPKWREELRYVLDPANEISEWLFGGAIGVGKTTVAVVSQFYKIYYLSCMRNPQAFYGLIDGSPIVFGLFNIFKYLAYDTSWQYFKEWANLSPYFKEITHTPDEKAKYVGFPHNIVVAVGAQSIHALGKNIFGGLLDEANFGKDKSLSSAERSQVFDLYTNTKRRMDSRFADSGGSVPGLLCLVSSARDQSDFLEEHEKAVGGDPRTQTSKFALWEVKDKYHRSGMFQVMIGDRRRSSQILDEGAPVPEGANVISVPEAFRVRFERDLDNSIRDIAGQATFGKSLLINRTEFIHTCVEGSTSRLHPFATEFVELSIEPDDKYNIVDGALDKGKLLRLVDKVDNRWEPRFHKAAPRCIHVDLAKNGDAAGISMVCISEVKTVRRLDADGQWYTTSDFVYFVDFVLQIRATAGSEIDFRKIREFIFYLRDVGFPILQVSYDGFGCFSGDTSVSLINGTETTLKELWESGEEQYYYSMDMNTGKVAVGGPAKVKKTAENVPLVEVVLDNGEKVKCTPDHLWLLTDGTYCQAKDLAEGESLAALYREVDEHGYEFYWDTDGRYEYTHRTSAREHVGDLVGKVVHHEEFDKRDNDPRRLVLMTRDNHFRLHSKLSRGRLVERNKSPEGRRRSSEAMKKWHADPENSKAHAARSSEELKRRHRERVGFTDQCAKHLIKYNKSDEGRAERRQRRIDRNKTPEHRAIVSAAITEKWKDPEYRSAVTAGAKKPRGYVRQPPRRSDITMDDIFCVVAESRTLMEAAGTLGCSVTLIKKRIRSINFPWDVFVRRYNFPRRNHKVVSVSPCPPEDVYDVENVPKHHNFALTAGVFVHNSIESIQELHKEGFNTKTVSVDKKAIPYHHLRSVILENRIDMYGYPILIQELSSLQDYSKGVRPRGEPAINHPDKGSKDCSDALCGAVYSLMSLKGTEDKPKEPIAYAPLKSGASGSSGWINPNKGPSINDLFED